MPDERFKDKADPSVGRIAGKKWMVLGSSPTASEFYSHPEVDLIGSAGDAITLVRPDYYFVTELDSLPRFVEERKKARSAGTKVIVSEERIGNIAGPNPRGTSEVRKLAQEWRLLQDKPATARVDEIVGRLISLGSWVRGGVGRRGSNIFVFPHDEWMEFNDIGATFIESWKVWEHGMYCQSNAGILALQWAVNHGATEVHMVGMEGYTGGIDYFTGEKGNDKSAMYFRQTFWPHTQRIVDKCPDIQFITYGKMNYPLKGNNVSSPQRSSRLQPA